MALFAVLLLAIAVFCTHVQKPGYALSRNDVFYCNPNQEQILKRIAAMFYSLVPHFCSGSSDDAQVANIRHPLQSFIWIQAFCLFSYRNSTGY